LLWRTFSPEVAAVSEAIFAVTIIDRQNFNVGHLSGLATGSSVGEERVGGLDVMRATAISLVLAHHLLGLVADRIPWPRSFLPSGPLGVDLFFALSGFLIGRILLGLSWGIMRPDVFFGFWKRRWLRTLPLYYLILAVNVAWAIQRNGHAVEILRASFPYLWFGQSLTSRAPLFFGESWSLAVEEWFYLLFPIGWACIIRAGVKPRPGYAICAILMLLVSLGLRLHLDPNVPRLWYYDVAMVTVYRMDSIAMGVIAAAVSLWRPDLWLRLRIPALVIGLIMLAADWIVLVDADLHVDDYMLVWHFVVTALGCALLLPSLSSFRTLPPGRLSRVISALALWSYGLYLVNSLLVSVVRFEFPALLKSSPLASWCVLFAVLAGSVAISALLHRWVERPFMDLRKRLPTIEDAQG
jgi:peptidoglycan/LPS O-acetylase OafA/YrhL